MISSGMRLREPEKVTIKSENFLHDSAMGRADGEYTSLCFGINGGLDTELVDSCFSSSTVNDRMAR